MPISGNNSGDADARRLVVAMELLTRQMRQQTPGGIITRREMASQDRPPEWADRMVRSEGATKLRPEAGPNERRARGGNAGAAVAGAAVAQALVTKFAVIFAPLVTLSTILGQTNSGFSVFQKSLQVLAAAIAPILLPVFVLLAAGILSLSDEIAARLLPRLKDWYGWILSKGIPTMEAFIKNVSAAADALTYLADRIRNPEKFLKDVVSPGKEGEKARGALERITDPFGVNKTIADFAKRIPGARTALPWLNFMGSKSETTQTAKELGQPKPSTPTSPAEKLDLAGMGDAMGRMMARTAEMKPDRGTTLKENLKLVTQSLMLSMSPKPSYQSLTEVGKSANLAAVGADPIEMKAMRLALSSLLPLIESIRDNTEKMPDPTFKGGR